MGFKRKLLGISLTVLMTLGFGASVLADDNDDEIIKNNKVDINILGSDLHLETSEIESFGDIVISEETRTYYTSFENEAITIKDLRGTGEGWELFVSATPFTQYYNGEDEYAGAYSLPEGSLTISGVEGIGYYENGDYIFIPSEEVPSGGSMPEFISLKERTIVDDGHIRVGGFAGFEAMGVYDYHFPEDALGLTIDPRETLKGEYESTITWTLVPYYEFGSL